MPSLFPRRPTRTINETVNGVDITYDIPDTTPIRRLPFNLDATLRRGLFTLAIVMTLGAIIWGTVAIGSMLTLLASPWAAYLVAGVFDAGWAACLIAEWLLRYDTRRATTPRRAGLAMLAVSMTAIVIHGALSGAWGWAIGIIGALVSAAAKGVWVIGMHTIRIKLDPKYEAYLDARRQQAGTEMALALGERDRLLMQDRTVALKLALETRRTAPVHEVNQTADHDQASLVHTADQDVNQIEPAHEPAPVHANQSTNRTADRTAAEDQIATLLKRLRVGESISKTQAAAILGVPESTAYRRLTAAKDQLRQYN